MKTFAATASALALLATGAYAQATDTVTLTATVAEYLEVTEANDSSLIVADPTGGSATSGNNNDNAEHADKSNFFVSANVDFDIILEWATWQVGGVGYNQAAYEGADCTIGGTISFDTNAAPNSTDTWTPPSGESPWNVTDDGRFPANVFTAGLDREFSIGIESSPNVNDCPGGIAPPDDYTLDVEITLAAATP